VGLALLLLFMNASLFTVRREGEVETTTVGDSGERHSFRSIDVVGWGMDRDWGAYEACKGTMETPGWANDDCG
jgi:hypothetical protein